MGCGASVHAQGPGQEEVKETTKSSSPTPIAEDVQAAQNPEVKEGAEAVEGRPAPASVPSPNPSAQPDPVPLQKRPSDVKSGTSAPDEAEDVLIPVVPCSAASSSAASAWEDQSQPPAPRLQPPSPLPPSPPPQQLSPAVNGTALEATRLVLGTSTASSSSTASDVDRPLRSCTPVTSSGVLDPAVTPTSQTATVTLLAPGGPSCFVARARYTDESDLSIASHSYDLDGGGNYDSDDDELAALFTLQSWKRYYNYNKRKPYELLTYFWRRFPPQDFSCFCMSYRNQDLLVTSYMAENCVHGYCARVEDLNLTAELFLQMYVLHDPSLDQYRIVGLLLVAGQALPPQLVALSAFDGFVYHRAETGRTLVKQFVSALLVGRSPLHSLTLISGREML